MSTVLTPKTDLRAELSLYCTVYDFTYIFFYPLSYFTSVLCGAGLIMALGYYLLQREQHSLNTVTCFIYVQYYQE